MLDSSAKLYADRPAFMEKRNGDSKYYPITFREYKSDVDSLGTALISLGLKDKRVAIISENRYKWAVSYLAVVNGTGVVVPIDKELPENEIESLLRRAKVSAVIFSDSKREQIENILPKMDIIEYYISMDAEEDTDKFLSFDALLAKGRKLLEEGNTEFTEAVIDPKVMSILLFTSATTDTSKAVMLSHYNICSNLMAMCKMIYVGPGDVFLSVLPLHHTYECTCGFLCPVYRGCTIAYCEGLRHIGKNLKEARATVMLGVPLLYEAMYKRIWEQARKNNLDGKLRKAIKINEFLKKFGIDLSRKLFAKIHEEFGGRIKIFISGAAGIDPDIAAGFRALGISLVQGYGLTECSPIVTLNRDIYFKDDAAGIPLQGVEIKIDSPNDEGIGEVVVKGPNVMLGYYEDDYATAKALQNGWFYTGDLGYIDEDGFLHITGRKKNVIVTKNGKNIYPEEIEGMLNKSPYIKESVVYGKNDSVYGDVVVSAIIVPDYDKFQEEAGGNQVNDDEVFKVIQREVKNVNKSLVTYKYIKDFKIRKEEFDKTTTRKIKRYLIKDEEI